MKHMDQHSVQTGCINSWVQYWGTTETCRPYRPSLTSTCSPTCCSSYRSDWWYRQVVGSWYNCEEQKSWSYLKMLSSFRSKTSGFWLLESKNTWFLKIFSAMASTTTALSHVDERIICEADINCACKHLYNPPVGLLGVTVEHQYAAFFFTVWQQHGNLPISSSWCHCRAGGLQTVGVEDIGWPGWRQDGS